MGKALILLLSPICALWFDAASASPRQYCARVGTDDVVRPAVPALAGPIQRLFGITGSYALKTTYYRCAAGHVMLCTVGANLSCGKADTNTALPQATEWCSSNPNSDFIPMAVTGHDTAYVWRCVNGVATAGQKPEPIDNRGFLSENWKELK